MALVYSKFASFILRLPYSEWRRLFLKLRAVKLQVCPTHVSNRGTVPLPVLSWRRQSVVCIKVLLSKISVQGVRKTMNLRITGLRTKNGIGYSANEAQQNAAFKLSAEFGERKSGSTRSIEKLREWIAPRCISTFASRDC
jgi:hypothetical protein